MAHATYALVSILAIALGTSTYGNDGYPMIRTLRRLFPMPTISGYDDPRIAERVAEKTASFEPYLPYQRASREEMFRIVHAAMFPNDAAHVHMNEAVRFVKAAEALGLVRFDSADTSKERAGEKP